MIKNLLFACFQNFCTLPVQKKDILANIVVIFRLNIKSKCGNSTQLLLMKCFSFLFPILFLTWLWIICWFDLNLDENNIQKSNMHYMVTIKIKEMKTIYCNCNCIYIKIIGAFCIYADAHAIMANFRLVNLNCAHT